MNPALQLDCFWPKTTSYNPLLAHIKLKMKSGSNPVLKFVCLV